MNELGDSYSAITQRPEVRALLDEGVASGRVSYNTVLRALGEDAVEDEAVEAVLEALEARHIQLVEDDELAAASSSTSGAPNGASTPSSTSGISTVPAAKEAAPVPEARAAHADLDEVLAAIDRMSSLPISLDDAAIESNLSDEAGDDEGPAVADAFRQYMDRMTRVPLLSQDEERELATRVRRGGPDAEDARQKLVEANLRLVVFMARKAEERTTLPLLDIVQEGTIGLMRAIDRFDPSRGHRLSTYATWWIRQSINRAVSEHGRSIKLPAQLSEAIQKLQRLQRELAQKFGRTPSRQELAEASGMTAIAVEEALRAALAPLSLESPVGGDADFELGESLSGGEEDAPASSLGRGELTREIVSVLSSLSERERVVLEKRFGLGDFAGAGSQTLEDVAEDLNLSRERVRQLEMRALRKLRRRSEHLRDDEDEA